MRWKLAGLEIALALFSIGGFPVKAFAKTTSNEGTFTYVSAMVSYKLEGRQEPPETTAIEIKDENTGMAYERTVSCMEIRENEVLWEDGFSFSLTVSGYDADQFLLGETLIPANDELSDYGEEFLSYLNLPPDCYRIENVCWDGDCYEKDGVICRDATADGEKLVRYVDVKYGGQVWIPISSTGQGSSKEREGVKEPETGEVRENIQNAETEIQGGGVLEGSKEWENGEYEEHSPTESPFAKLRHYVREHMTVVTLGSLFFCGIFGCTTFLWLLGKNEKKKEKPD